MRKQFIASFLAVSVLAASGCQSMGVNKEQIGTLAGGAVGVLIGSQIGGGKGKVLATVLMGGAGAYIGNRIGSMLDKRDQEALAAQTQQLLNQDFASSSQQPVFWQSEHSGAKAEIQQGEAFEKPAQVEVKRVATIQSVPSMKLIQAPYVSMKSANVRSAPDQQADKVGGLQPGTEFTAVGSTGNWILVGRKGVTVGYVHKDLVAPKAVAAAKRVQPSTNLDEINVAANPETKGFDLDSLPTTSTTVAANSTCRPVSISVTAANGKTDSESSTYCKQGNGTWELI